jgi:hypothetical protein
MTEQLVCAVAADEGDGSGATGDMTAVADRDQHDLSDSWPARCFRTLPASCSSSGVKRLQRDACLEVRMVGAEDPLVVSEILREQGNSAAKSPASR